MNNFPFHLHRSLGYIGFRTEETGNGFMVVQVSLNGSRWIVIHGDTGSTASEAIARTASHLVDFV